MLNESNMGGVALGVIGRSEMADESRLREFLADAHAYQSIGEVDNAVDVYLEALDYFGPESDPSQRIYVMLGDLCCRFWDQRDFVAGVAVASRIVATVLVQLGRKVPTDYLDTYVTACISTGSTPFPIRRLFRHQNLLSAFRQVHHDDIRGDVAECGCARGLSFLQLCLDFGKSRPGWQGEGFHVFDSFKGLSEPTDKDLDFGVPDATVSANMVAGHYAFPLELVRGNIHRLYPRAQFHPGWIPSSFAVQPERIYRFVHIDVDLYQPTFDSLVYFLPRLAENGIIITDDFNWPGVRRAFEQICSDRGLELFTTDTNQAYIVGRSAP